MRDRYREGPYPGNFLLAKTICGTYFDLDKAGVKSEKRRYLDEYNQVKAVRGSAAGVRERSLF